MHTYSRKQRDEFHVLSSGHFSIPINNCATYDDFFYDGNNSRYIYSGRMHAQGYIMYYINR